MTFLFESGSDQKGLDPAGSGYCPILMASNSYDIITIAQGGPGASECGLLAGSRLCPLADGCADGSWDRAEKPPAAGHHPHQGQERRGCHQRAGSHRERGVAPARWLFLHQSSLLQGLQVGIQTAPRLYIQYTYLLLWWSRDFTWEQGFGAGALAARSRDIWL